METPDGSEVSESSCAAELTTVTDMASEIGREKESTACASEVEVGAATKGRLFSNRRAFLHRALGPRLAQKHDAIARSRTTTTRLATSSRSPPPSNDSSSTLLSCVRREEHHARREDEDGDTYEGRVGRLAGVDEGLAVLVPGRRAVEGERPGAKGDEARDEEEDAELHATVRGDKRQSRERAEDEEEEKR